MTEIVAALERVSKSFGDAVALREVSYSVSRGSVLAVLGPNGAGKTTSLSVLLGLRRPDSGRATLFGLDPQKSEARALLGTTPQELSFPPTLRVAEIIDLVRAHYDHPLPRDRLLEQHGLAELCNRQTGALSGGQKRRLAVALAFAGAPELVVLDEPTTGLDVEARRSTWAAVHAYAGGGGAVVLTTHYLEEAEALASTMVVLERGEVVAAGRTAELRAAAGLTRISFLREELKALPGTHVAQEGGRTVIQARDAVDVIRQLLHSGARLEHLEVAPLPLEEALRNLERGTK